MPEEQNTAPVEAEVTPLEVVDQAVREQNDTSAQAAEAAKQYPIEMISEELLKDATIAQCEHLLSHMNMISGTLRAKAHIVHAVMDQKKVIRDAARKDGVMTEADKEALKALWAEQDRIKASDLPEEAKAAALAKLVAIDDKPPAQHLVGDHITKDAEGVNPGGETVAAPENA